MISEDSYGAHRYIRPDCNRNSNRVPLFSTSFLLQPNPFCLLYLPASHLLGLTSFLFKVVRRVSGVNLPLFVRSFSGTYLELNPF